MTGRLPGVPGKLPALREEHIIRLPEGTTLLRAHNTQGAHPTAYDQFRHFGPLPDKGRFDHHPPGPPRDHSTTYGVLYAAADDPRAAAPEPVAAGDGAVPGNALDVVLSELVQADLERVLHPGLTLSAFAPSADLTLLDVRGGWAQTSRAGVHLSAAPHHEVQPWARAIRRDYPHLHGILYAPSTGGRAAALALNESAAPAITGCPLLLSLPLAGSELLGVVAAAAERLGILLTLP